MGCEPVLVTDRPATYPVAVVVEATGNTMAVVKLMAPQVQTRCRITSFK
jgi:hypothetical protein